MNTKQTLLVFALSSVLVACGSGSSGGAEITEPTVHNAGDITVKEFPTAANGNKLFVFRQAIITADKGKYLSDEVKKSTYDGKRLRILGKNIDLSEDIILLPEEQQGFQLRHSEGSFYNSPGQRSEYAKLGSFGNFTRDCDYSGWGFSDQYDICTKEGFINYIEGVITPVDELPTGIVTYSSASGDAEVDFANKELTGSIKGSYYDEYNFKAKIFANTFRSTSPYSTGEYTSSAAGGFYGPQAADMAGHIVVLDNTRGPDFSYPFVLHKEE